MMDETPHAIHVLISVIQSHLLDILGCCIVALLHTGLFAFGRQTDMQIMSRLQHMWKKNKLI